MSDVNVTELRRRLPDYLRRARKGEEIRVVSRGKPVARILAQPDAAVTARRRLFALRRKCRVGDVESPAAGTWNAERGRL